MTSGLKLLVTQDGCVGPSSHTLSLQGFPTGDWDAGACLGLYQKWIRGAGLPEVRELGTAFRDNIGIWGD